MWGLLVVYSSACASPSTCAQRSACWLCICSYSGSDLAAILGGGGGPVAAPEAEEQAAPTAFPVITEQAAPEGAMDEYPSHLEEAAGEQEADAGQQRWWHRYFVPAGRLGSKAADCQQTRPADAAPVKVAPTWSLVFLPGLCQDFHDYHCSNKLIGALRQSRRVMSR